MKTVEEIIIKKEKYALIACYSQVELGLGRPGMADIALVQAAG